MIKIDAKKNCCGCAACAQSCPKQCITMAEDNEGFLYPQVNAAECIDCGLCEKVCHELHPYAERKPQQVLAAINPDEEVRMHSSSGGVFHALASQVIAEGGVVFGARFDTDWQVVIDYTETPEGIRAFMGSKYVQARTETAFRDAKQFLQAGRKVLFSGTPCQIAALHHFLRRDYDHLLTVDVVCHGTPSPRVWRMYLDEVLRKGQRISSVEFRNKKQGWKKFCFQLQYHPSDNTTSMLSPAWKNHYMKAFLSDIILRPSCYACRAKSGRSHADITIADFWGIQVLMPDMDDDRGTGMVFLHTEKGKEALNALKLRKRTADYEQVLPLNPAVWRSATPHPKRTQFFELLDSAKSLIALIDRITRPSALLQVRILLSRCKQFTLRTLRKVTRGGV